jgi:hypothetical protein
VTANMSAKRFSIAELLREKRPVRRPGDPGGAPITVA